MLLADGSDAITNGYERVFGKPQKRIMCWAHVVRNVDKHLKSIAVKDKLSIKTDISALQLALNSNIFNAAYELFQDKWKSKNSAIGKLFYTCTFL